MLASAGNGEGYGGKLNGIYASVDKGNKCGLATPTSLPILDQIEIRDGMIFKTIANCQKLAFPQAIILATLQSSSENSQVIILQGLIFQKANWVNTGWAPRDQYIDIFCKEQSIDGALLRTADLFIYNTVAGSQLQSSPILPNGLDEMILNRTGLLQISKYNVQTDKVISSQDQFYQLQDTLSYLNAGQGLLHSIQFGIDAQAAYQSFLMSFSSMTTASLMFPQQMNFVMPSMNPVSTPTSMCWKGQ